MGRPKSGGGGGGGPSDDAKIEQKLQAVLLADSFTRTFCPLSLDQSKALCPLNNVTLLDYAMEFLAGTGVEELFVVCWDDQVEEHVSRHHVWGKTMAVTCVKDLSLTNAGDALRELDKRNLVQSDPFILMYGDIVTNVDLKEALQAHKDRHKKDSSAMMTLLFQNVGATGAHCHSALRASREDLMVGFDPSQDNRILVYDDHTSNKSVSIPCSFFANHPQLELHTNLLDCGIDICSPDVLARFSDEFDYRDIRKEFVANSVAEEEEGLQNKIYAHLLNDSEYAARVHDFKTYAAISKDLLKRWCYPVVPDNLPSGYEQQYRYALQRHFLYRERKQGRTKIGRSSVLKNAGMVGSLCHIGEGCNIDGTVIGHECFIANNVTLKDCHVWNGVTIDEGATVVQSILGHGCVIKTGAVVGRGCIIGNGCVIGANVILPEFTRITKAIDHDSEDLDDGFGDFEDSDDSGDDEEDNDSDDDDDGEVEPHDKVVISDHNVVGPEGIGRVWIPSIVDDEEEEEDQDSTSKSEILKAQSIGYNAIGLYQKRVEWQCEEEDDFSDEDDMDQGFDSNDFNRHEDDDDDDDNDFGGSLATFGAGDASNLDEHGVLITGRQRGVDVVKELKTICLEHEMTSPVENLAIELNSFKFSQNATYSDCTMAAMLAILETMKIDTHMSDGKLVAGLKFQLEHWSPLLRKMSIGLDEEKSIVAALETSATSGGAMGATLSQAPAFRFLLQTLHDAEIVSEEAILSWAAERKEEGPDSPRGKLFQQQPTQDFLEWLEEESEEDSDDSDSDDE